MRPTEELPAFPPPGFVSKVLELGFGSGPWSRADFDERWGRSSANRFVDEGKKAGWVLSPYQNTFYVPPAQDLALMSWLPGLPRAELGIGRTLALMGLQAWCMSAWLSGAGLDFEIPLFVTDLRMGTGGEILPLVSQRGLPFAGNLVVVPRLPAMDPVGVTRTVRLFPGAPSRAAPAPAGGLPVMGGDPQALRVVVSPALGDAAWFIALAASLGIPRVVERLPQVQTLPGGRSGRSARKVGRRGQEDLQRRALRWLGTFGQPAPNSSWPGVAGSGAGAYLLVPDALWKEVAAAAFAQRYEAVERMAR